MQIEKVEKVKMNASAVTVGCKLQVLKIIGDESFWREGEVLATRQQSSGLEFYIHYINFNKRLDEWVPVDRMDFTTVVLPKPEPAKKEYKKKHNSSHKKSSVERSSSDATVSASADAAAGVAAADIDDKSKMALVLEEELDNSGIDRQQTGKSHGWLDATILIFTTNIFTCLPLINSVTRTDFHSYQVQSGGN